MKLEVGMYVRTKEGLIAKYIKINNKYEWHVFDNKIQWFYEYYRNEIDFDRWEDFIKEKVVKASYNIIDLIGVGDIVVLINGFCKEELMLIRDLDIQKSILDTHKIISIVTKEQFESMSYKVGE